MPPTPTLDEEAEHLAQEPAEPPAVPLVAAGTPEQPAPPAATPMVTPERLGPRTRLMTRRSLALEQSEASLGDMSSLITPSRYAVLEGRSIIPPWEPVRRA
jgi:hypothetical protein